MIQLTMNIPKLLDILKRQKPVKLARKLEIYCDTVLRWRRGEYYPSYKTINKMLEKKIISEEEEKELYEEREKYTAYKKNEKTKNIS